MVLSLMGFFLGWGPAAPISTPWACWLLLACRAILLDLGRVGHMLLSMQYPRFCNYLRFAFFPSGAAVCAQHIRRLPKGCRACQIVGSSSKIALLKSIAKIAGQGFMPSCLPPHPFSFPPGPHRPLQRPQICLLNRFGLFFFDFLAFQIAL